MRKLFLSLVLASFALSAAAQHVLGNDATYKQKVYAALSQKQADLPTGDLFAILRRKDLTSAERDALTFLYAYMNTTDIVDHTGEYFLRQVRLALQVQQETTWGRQIPDQLFRHFVLPNRVNNEALDDSRGMFVRNLLPRLKGLTATEAILEVNHWCHEHVTYAPSDSRTSAPLATMKNALGRCGEESTFTVAALRAVGIPARQVYTPRWAHSDDNHAWVEAWADGKWHFLGACEPEAILDLGWFNLPASRGLLMHTNVFGDYNGPELVMKRTKNFTEINVTSNYAQTGYAEIHVIDRDGNPAADVDVAFKIYNYAELYTAARRHTDAQGITSFEAGQGTAFFYASKDGYYGFKMVAFGKEKQVVTLQLNHKVGDEFASKFRVTPPVGSDYLPLVTPQQKALNEQRLKDEDAIRTQYTNTFLTLQQATARVEQLGYNATVVAPLLVKARGNQDVILKFLNVATKLHEGQRATALLQSLREKDLHDTSLEILMDHLAYSPKAVLDAKVLCPRVGMEMLSAYRYYFLKHLPKRLQKQWRQHPASFVEWVKQHIAVRNDLNSTNIIASPVGVWKSKTATTMARKVFFVAVLRTLGVPAWMDEVDNHIYYQQEGRQVFVDFDHTQSDIHRGDLQLIYTPIATVQDPVYYTNFTLSRFDGSGFSLMNYPEDNTSTWSTLFKNGSKVEEGYYMCVAGNRAADGSVDATVRFFNVKAGEKQQIPLEVPELTDPLTVVGNIDLTARFHRVGSAQQEILRSVVGNDYYVVGILEPNKEPTNHALKDIERVKERFEQWGRPMVILFQSEEAYAKFKASDFPNLPKNIIWGILTDTQKIPTGASLPTIILANTRSEMLFKVDGYTIGMGEQIMKVVQRL